MLAFKLVHYLVTRPASDNSSLTKRLRHHQYDLQWGLQLCQPAIYSPANFTTLRTANNPFFGFQQQPNRLSKRTSTIANASSATHPTDLHLTSH